MSDYERVAQAIEFIVAQAEHQPSLEAVAAHLGLSPYHFQRLFSRWAGVTPKRFLQVLTVERAKQLLGEARPLLEVSDLLGLSSGSRLYDHFVQLEAVTPGQYKRRGEGLNIDYGWHDSPFGPAFVAGTERGLCSFFFVDPGQARQPLAELQAQWPAARLCENPARTRAWVEAMFARPPAADRPLSLHVSGTNFQVHVWKALLRIPPGAVRSYGDIAAALGRPGAARAVGRAVGLNPVGFLIPCHRVIEQSGRLGGYRWGTTRKLALHAWESARLGT